MYCCFQSIISIFLLVSSLALFSEAAFNGYSDCHPSPHQCGYQHFMVSFPFLYHGIPEQCGHPDFQLYCNNSIGLVMEIGSKDYKVNYINYTTHEIQVSNIEFANGTCKSEDQFTNPNFDLSLFGYSNQDVNLTVYLNCLSPVQDLSHLYKLSCGTTDPMPQSFYKMQNYTLPTATVEALSGCKPAVTIPVYQTAEKELMMNGMDGFWKALQEGFGLTWKLGDTWCAGCEKSSGICGYNSSLPDDPICHCSESTSLNGVCVKHGDGWHSKRTMAIVVGFAGFVLVSLSLALCLYKHKKIRSSILCEKHLNDNQSIEDFLAEYGSVAPKRYTYSQLKKFTKAFKEELGQGGYGTVFKGTLIDGHIVAVKMLKESKGNGEEFMNEVASIGRTSHVNIVSLLGFCFEGQKRALVYDFMCNGSLEKLLNTDKPKTILHWEKLHQIAIGIARGLEYLHRGCNTRIVHFDIKPHNILLDQDFCPKISDFGLAKLCLVKDSIISLAGARGTIGYIAPEVFSRNFGVVSSKSDVYSYGMMVLEMAEGKKNPNHSVKNSSEMYFPHWIYEHLQQNQDLLLCGVNINGEETVRKMILVGLWCIQTLPQNRPSMSRVIEMLEGSVNDLQLPPKPYLSSSPFGSVVDASLIQEVSLTDDYSEIS